MSIARTLTIAAAAAGVALGGVALAPAAGAATGDTVVINCVGKGQVKPKEIVITCADAGVMVTKIKWSKWTNNEAKGTGTLVWNTCLPKTCVDGIVQNYKAKVTLGRVASGPNISVFSGMTLTFTGGGGPAAADSVSYIIDRPIQ
ncbi:MAG: hypothetical protein WCP95_04525 [Actinomycetes bacterium]